MIARGAFLLLALAGSLAQGNLYAEPQGQAVGCPAGYSGTGCHVAACSGHGAFSCKCTANYEGDMCQSPVNVCNATSVIHNGAMTDVPVCGFHGHCSAWSFGPVCTCDTGYTGPFCQIPIDSCLSNPCINGGTCENVLGGGFKCHCFPRFIGERCEHIPDFCQLAIPEGSGSEIPVHVCGEHGNCTSLTEGILCDCHPGWTGLFCDVEIKSSCAYTDHDGVKHSYPHNSVWVDDCNECRCEYGRVECAHSLWCPRRCAIYGTDMTRAANVTVGCQAHENCIPDKVECAAPKPTCLNPIGWCFPAGHIMVDDLELPTNPPSGYRAGGATW